MPGGTAGEISCLANEVGAWAGAESSAASMRIPPLLRPNKYCWPENWKRKPCSATGPATCLKRFHDWAPRLIGPPPPSPNPPSFVSPAPWPAPAPSPTPPGEGGSGVLRQAPCASKRRLCAPTTCWIGLGGAALCRAAAWPASIPRCSRATTAAGLVVPELLEGARVLDLGLRQRPRTSTCSPMFGGADRSVMGIDMTPPAVWRLAEGPSRFHAERFRLRPTSRPGGKALETLGEAWPLVRPASIWWFPTVCVEPLPDKLAVLGRGAAPLKARLASSISPMSTAIGGVPEALLRTRCLYGECLSGALYWERLPSKLARRAGFPDSAPGERPPLAITDSRPERAHRPLRFFSATTACSPIDGLEDSLRRTRPGRDLPRAEFAATLRLSLRQAPRIEAGRVSPSAGQHLSGCWPKAATRPTFPFIRQLRSPLTAPSRLRWRPSF